MFGRACRKFQLRKVLQRSLEVSAHLRSKTKCCLACVATVMAEGSRQALVPWTGDVMQWQANAGTSRKTLGHSQKRNCCCLDREIRRCIWYDRCLKDFSCLCLDFPSYRLWFLKGPFRCTKAIVTCDNLNLILPFSFCFHWFTLFCLITLLWILKYQSPFHSGVLCWRRRLWGMESWAGAEPWVLH